MAKKVLSIFCVILTIVFIFLIYYFLLNEHDNKSYAQNVPRVLYEQDDLEFSKQYGDTVSKAVYTNKTSNVSSEEMYAYYDEDVKRVFEYNKKLDYFFSLKYSIFKDEDKLVKISVTKYLPNSLEGDVVGQVYFNSDEPYFNYSGIYGFYRDDEFYIYNTNEKRIELFENEILNEILKMSKQLYKEENQSFDDISKNIITVKEAGNVNDFVPEDFEIINELTLNANLNNDNLEDKVIVMERKQNYVTTSNYYVYPRIALVLFKQENGLYIVKNYISNLIAPKSASADIEDSFKGFTINGKTIIARNEFHLPLQLYYVEKLLYDENNELVLAGYTKGSQKSISGNPVDKFYITRDYNLLTGEIAIDIVNNETKVKKNYRTKDEKRKIAYVDNIYYNMEFDVIDKLENKFISKFVES